ncbi:lamin tail domain-containing protein [Halobellus inordinatus]|uniref:lamin tail domain-containing protein n=1 Tax=Halobellus inordinatus TaxID=1126236 RepID=UPI003F6E13A7
MAGMRAVTLVVLLLVVASGCLGGTPGAGTGPAESAATATPTTGSTATAAPVEGDDVTVTEVVDGDTIKVAYPNGTRETVRLLGVDTPEVYGENTPDEFEGIPETTAGAACLGRAGEDASAYAKDRLAGESVTLVFDEQSDRRGYYGRLLAYVYVDGESFNYALLREGHARVYDSTFTERERYEDMEVTARESRRGLWSCIEGDVTATASETTALADGGEGPLAIDTIHADAEGNDNENLNDEYVVFRNAGEERLDLSGWTVTDDADHTYTVPEGTTLDPGATLTLRTGSGTDSDSTLYWGASGAIWNNAGDVVTVRDASGSTVVRRSY